MRNLLHELKELKIEAKAKAQEAIEVIIQVKVIVKIIRFVDMRIIFIHKNI